MSVFLTGIYGSGVSVLARVLNTLGFYFGEPGAFKGPAHSSGHALERKDVVQINNQLLSTIQASWDWPKPLAADLCARGESTFHNVLVQSATQILARLETHQPWAIQDPRLCLTMPFWLRRCPEARVIVCLRNPFEVGLFLQNKHGLTENFGVQIWPLYYQSVIAETQYYQRLVVSYEEMLNEPRKQVERVAAWLGLSASDEALQNAATLIDVMARHHKVNDLQKRLDRPFHTVIRPIYNQLLEESYAVAPFNEDSGRPGDEGRIEPSVEPGPAESASGMPKVPRRIVQYWDAEKVPDELVPIMATWRQMNPGCEYALYNDKTAAGFILEHYGTRAHTAYQSCAFPAMKADFFRYLYIYKRGGYYADADDACVVPISDLEDPRAELLVGKVRIGNWGNNFFGASVGNPVMGQVVEQVLSNIENRISDNLWLVTGPGAFSPIVQRAIESGKVLAKTLEAKEYRGGAIRSHGALEYKKEDNHWSKAQKQGSIFKDQAGSEGAAEKVSSEAVPVIIHLGPHKTATTLIQLAIKKREEELQDMGIAFVCQHSKLHGDKYKELRVGYSNVLTRAILDRQAAKKINEAEVVQALAASLKAIVNLKPEHCSRLILSDENLLGHIVGHYIGGSRHKVAHYYQCHDLVFEAIAKIFHGTKIKVVLSRRGLREWIPSAYKDLIQKMVKPLSYLEYVEALPERLDKEVESLYDAALAKFGQSNVEIIDFDALRQRGNALFLKDCEDIFQAPNLRYFRGVSMPNSSLSWGQIESALALIPTLTTPPQRHESLKSLRADKSISAQASAAFMAELEKAQDLLKDKYLKPGLPA